jgi:hypothetical protein
VLEAVGQLAGDEVLVDALIKIRHPGTVAVPVPEWCRVLDNSSFPNATGGWCHGICAASATAE